MELKYNNKKSFSEIETQIKECQNNNKPIFISNTHGALIKGDNFEIMSRMLESYEGKIDLIYIDPPFNTSSQFYYDEDKIATISTTKNSELAYNDNMKLENYVEFMRERLYLIKKLLSDKGTLYLHIDLKVGHYMKIILDEIFGIENYINDITRIKSNPKNFSRKAYGNEKDVIYIYSKKPQKNIFNNIKISLDINDITKMFTKVDENGERYTTIPCHAPGETINGATGQAWNGIMPPRGRHWRSSPEELEKLNQAGLIEWSINNIPRIKKYAKNHEGKKIQDIWKYKDPQYPIYPTEKNFEMLDMIVKQSSNENSLIMDCFCGSSSFLKAGIVNKRKVIGIDKSDIAFYVSKNRKELNFLEIIED